MILFTGFRVYWVFDLGSRNWEQVEQQYQKALEEDPTAFDYDGVYDEMKGNQARPIHEDRAKREVGVTF